MVRMYPGWILQCRVSRIYLRASAAQPKGRLPLRPAAALGWAMGIGDERWVERVLRGLKGITLRGIAVDPKP